MSALPLLDGRLLWGQAESRRTFAGQLRDACRATGAFYLANAPISSGLCERVLEGARLFFDLPAEEKAEIHISRSPHFRGYSQMHNERDWREQIHFSLEESPIVASSENDPAYLRLQGPNLWPARLGQTWRSVMLGFLDEVGALGQRLLESLALVLALPDEGLLQRSSDLAYLLLKLINYHPRPPHEPRRPGVAPHCDWSWLTILLQDEVGGLQVRTPAGEWVDVPPLPGTFIVNIGELLEMVTGGVLEATPHRVWNHSASAPRISAPVFVNPPLPAVVASTAKRAISPAPEIEHVHRVLEPGKAWEAFVFGESEWRRKALGQWCHNAACRQP